MKGYKYYYIKNHCVFITMYVIFL